MHAMVMARELIFLLVINECRTIFTVLVSCTKMHQTIQADSRSPFINVSGDRLIAESGDSKSKKFLFERISLAIQCGNAASIRGTFSDSALLSEIFEL
jgi:hypothetical protein